MLNKIYEKTKKFFKENIKFIIFLVAIYALFSFELPYVIYTPGGAINLENRIEVEDGHEAEGKLQMAYVSMVKGSIPFVLLSHVLPNWDLTKKSDITYEDESISDMVKRDKIYLEQSIDNAIIEAFKMTDNKINVTNTINNVAYITKDADTTLLIGDNIVSVNGVKISSLDEYKKIIQEFNEFDIVNIKVIRDGKEKDVSAKIFKAEEELKTGIMLVTTYEYETSPKVEIKSKATESGPSGGLMLALGIYNQLVEEDITKGRNIIGTGTIEQDGKVGEIGGVKYKLIGAVKNKADIFICPIDNLEEALQVKKDNNYNIKIIGVSTLEEAIKELRK